MHEQVLHITRSRMAEYGGVESHLRELRIAGRALGMGVRVACALAENQFDFSLPVNAIGNGATPFGVSRFLDDLPHILKRTHTTYLHLHNLHIPTEPGLYEGILHAARRVNCPVALSIHDMLTRVASVKTLREQLRSASRPNVVIANSRFTKSLIPSELQNITEIVHGGINFREFNFVAKCPPEQDQLDLFAPSRLVAQKGLTRILRAFAHVQRHRPRSTLIFSSLDGSSDLKFVRHLQAEVARLRLGDSVSFLPETFRAADAYQRAHLTVFAPYRPEGQGLVPIESLACGTPVVATATGGIIDLVELFGDNDRPMAISIGDDLAEAILSAAERYAELSAIADSARKTLLRSYSFEAVARRLMATYHKHRGHH